MMLSPTKIALIVLLVTTASTAAPPAKQPKPRLDRYGDPLPKGAVGRLGTTRLRHSGPVTGVAFSPDGKTLVSTSWSSGNSIRLWDVKTAKLKRTLPGIEYEGTFAAAYTPDGQILASVGTSGHVRVWDPAVGDELYNKRAHRGRVYGVAFSHDGKMFASAGGDGSICVWSTFKGKQLRAFHTTDKVRDHHAVAFSPDGKWLASGAEVSITLWNLRKGGKHKTIEGVGGRAIVSLHYTPDGKHLISSGYRYVTERLPDGKRVGRSVAGIDVWDMKTLKKRQSFKDGKTRMSACSTALSKDGKSLVSIHHDRIRIWDVRSGKLRRTISDNHNSSGFRTHGAALSPEGKILAVRGPRCTVLLWNVTTGKRLHRFPNSHEDRVHSCAVSPNGKHVATTSGDGTVRLWDRKNGRPLRVVRFGHAKNAVAKALRFSPDGKVLAAGGYDHNPLHTFVGWVELLDPSSGSKTLSKTAAGRVQDIALTADGKRIAIATGLGDLFREADSPTPSIAIWDFSNGRAIGKLQGPQGAALRMAFSKDGKRVVAADSSASVRVWDVRNKKLIKQFVAGGHRRGTLFSAAFSPDRQTVATSGLFGPLVILRDMKTSKVLRRLTIENSHGSVLAFSPDGRVVATASFGASPKTKKANNAIRLWRVSTGKQLKEMPHDGVRVTSLAFTPDGKRLYSGMNDGTTLVWDTTLKKGK